MTNKPVILIILDGWGLAPPGPGNAISQAKIPNLERLWAVYPRTQLSASGEAVGLPKGERGNSETGHLNLGAGQVIFQDLPRINMAIASGNFFSNQAFLKAVNHVKKYNSALHFLGLIGAGGVHSSIEHLLALLYFAKENEVKNLYLHLFTDGRDSPPTSALIYLTKIDQELKKLKIGKIATIIGRYFAMDRDNRWERTQKAYEALTLGKGKIASSYTEAIQNAYSQKITDEFIEPIILEKNGLIKDNDAVIFFNFRIDRPRQLTKAFVLSNFEQMKIKKPVFDPYAERYGLKIYEIPKGTTTFKRKKILKNLLFVTMTEYEKGLPVEVAFPPEPVPLSLARILAENGLRQLHMAESEKYPHVTVFFDGGRETPFPGEEWEEVASPKVSTYDMKPEMSAFELTEKLLEKLRRNIYDFVLVNFANPDMVGHTGVISAGIKACEVVDECVGKIINTVLGLEGTVIITADHGNIEEMINLSTGEIDTEHSTNPVPFIVVNKQFNQGGRILPRGILADVAPTILFLLGLEKPGVMTGKNLLSF